ncbi:hypothetical protein HZS_6252, partial [Henneguya salminicola]
MEENLSPDVVIPDENCSEIINTPNDSKLVLLQKNTTKKEKNDGFICPMPKTQKTGTKQWPYETMKLFFIGLKSYGKNFVKLDEFIRYKDATYDKAKDSVRDLYRRLLQKTTNLVKKYINKFQVKFLKFIKSKLTDDDIKKKLGIYLTENNRTQTDELRLVLAYGELYCSDIFSDPPRAHQIKKLYDLLINGCFSYVKNGTRFTINLPYSKILDNNSNVKKLGAFRSQPLLPFNVINMNRIYLKLRPKSLSVLLLMKQRAFTPHIKLDIPFDCRVEDVVDKLGSYWRLPKEPIKNIMTLYCLSSRKKEDNTEKLVIRNLLSQDFFIDLKSPKDTTIPIFYDLNTFNIPEFDYEVLTCLSLNALPALAKNHLSTLKDIKELNKEPVISPKIAPILLPINPIKSNLIRPSKPSRIRVKSILSEPKKPEFHSLPISPPKRRVLTLPITPTNTGNNEQAQPLVSYDANFQTEPQEEFNFKLFGSNKKQNTNMHNISASSHNLYDSESQQNLSYENQGLFDISRISNQNSRSDFFDYKFSNMDMTSQLPKFQDADINIVNEESNLGFIRHFGIRDNQNIQSESAYTSQIMLQFNEDSLPPTTVIQPGILETPKFESKKTNEPHLQVMLWYEARASKQQLA